VHRKALTAERGKTVIGQSTVLADLKWLGAGALNFFIGPTFIEWGALVFLHSSSPSSPLYSVPQNTVSAASALSQNHYCCQSPKCDQEPNHKKIRSNLTANRSTFCCGSIKQTAAEERAKLPQLLLCSSLSLFLHSSPSLGSSTLCRCYARS